MLTSSLDIANTSVFLFDLRLELTVPVVSLSNQTIQEAKVNSTVLKCIITSGYPAPNITWYKDGAELRLLSLRSVDDCRITGFHYMENDRPPFTRDLVICKPKHVENTGIYKCEAENIKGSHASEAFLNVLGLCSSHLLLFKVLRRDWVIRQKLSGTNLPLVTLCRHYTS